VPIQTTVDSLAVSVHFTKKCARAAPDSGLDTGCVIDDVILEFGLHGMAVTGCTSM
jgi:hypothetical protein